MSFNPSFDQALTEDQLAQHRVILSTSMGASAIAGVVITGFLWSASDRLILLAWGACLAAVLGLRFGVGWAHRRAGPGLGSLTLWRFRYRLCFLAHGLVWAVAGMLFLPKLDGAQLDLLTFVLVAIAAGSLVASAFDLVAAALFAIPALTPLTLYHIAHPGKGLAGLGYVMLVFVLSTAMSALRVNRMVRAAVGARLMAQQQAQEARASARQAANAVEELTEKQELLSTLLHNTQQGFWFINDAGITTDLNPAMCAILGRTSEEVVGKSAFDWFEGSDLAAMRMAFEGYGQDTTGGYEVDVLRPDGARRHCITNPTAIRKSNGGSAGYIGIWSDITERKRAEVALRIYELAVNSITDMVSVVGDDRTYRMVNDAWCRLTGRSRADAIGRSSSDMLSSLASPERRQALSNCIENQQIGVIRGTVNLPELQGRYVETTYYPHADSGHQDRCVVMVTRDVTEQEESSLQLALGAQYLHRTLNATGDAIFATDGSDQNQPVRFFNEQMLQMWRIELKPGTPLTPRDVMAAADALFAHPADEHALVAQIIAARLPHESKVDLHDGRVLLRRHVPATVGERSIRVWSFRDITAEEHAVQVLRNSEAEQNALLDAFPGFITRLDENLVYTYVNQRVAQRVGTTREAMVGRRLGEVVGPEREAWLLGFLQRALAGEQVTYERHHAVEGTDGLTDQVTLAIGSDPRTGACIYYSFGVDITERKRAEAQLRIAAVAFEAQEGIMVTDANNVILKVNHAFTVSTGYRSEELVGQSPSILHSGRHPPEFYRDLWETIHRTGGWQGEIWDKRKNGEIYPKWLNVCTVKNAEGVVTNYVGTHFDITERKRAEERIQELAYFDDLTRLPNRSLLLDRLKQAMAAGNRSATFGAVLSIDIDYFKKLNDTFGRDSGDILLQMVAQRLTACVRECDTVARLGGDEFIVLLMGLSGVAGEAANQVEDVGNKILDALRRVYHLGEVAHHSSVSIGAALFRGSEVPVDDLMKQADLAMHGAKDTGRNVLRFFDPAMQAVILEYAALESGLRTAVRDGQLVLHYQPQITGERTVAGAEALVRWMHPQRGMVSPAEFIPVAEETGLILPLGLWVLETACRQLARWAEQPALGALVVAVNVSALQLQQPDFVSQVVGVLERTRVNPQRLKLELTESLLVSNIGETIAKMTALRAVGVGFSLDDFGTGYSSLAYLSRLPLDQLKIDRSFVMGIESSDDAVVICSATISLAHSLKLKVVAEGVETEAQRYFLSTVHHCDLIQGFLFSRPLPVDDFEAFVRR